MSLAKPMQMLQGIFKVVNTAFMSMKMASLVSPLHNGMFSNFGPIQSSKTLTVTVNRLSVFLSFDSSGISEKGVSLSHLITSSVADVAQAGVFCFVLFLK